MASNRTTATCSGCLDIAKVCTAIANKFVQYSSIRTVLYLVLFIVLACLNTESARHIFPLTIKRLCSRLSFPRAIFSAFVKASRQCRLLII